MENFNVKTYLENNIQKALESCGLQFSGPVLSYSGRPEIADFQCNVAFTLAKTYHKNPMEIANSLAQKLTELVGEYFTVAVIAPAFINFSFTQTGLAMLASALVSNKNYGINTTLGSGKTVVLDYGGANVAKELHMGHLRSPIIGEALKRIYNLFGYHTVSDVHMGDWGLQMGLVLAILEEQGAFEYYLGNSTTKPQITLEFLNENYPKASKRSKTDPEFKKKADDYTLKLQRKEEPFYTIWKEIRDVSVTAIMRNYKTLNCTFDLWYGESNASDYIPQTIQIFQDKGLAYESEGALVVDVKREGEHIPIPKKDPNDPQEKQLYKNPMPPVMIKKYNGGDLYATTDIATILQRVKDYKDLTEIVYIVDKRQSAHHFQGVFRASLMAGICPNNVTLTNIGYGTMNGKDGKPFKTRDGGSIKLEDIINMVSSKAQEKLAQNGVDGNEDNLAIKIGVSAMKFGDLSNDINRDYIFDLESFMSFEGKTGPYLQYTAVRINSILAKAGDFTQTFCTGSQEEKNILIAMLKLADAYSIALQEKSPSVICNALYNLASAYSTFYNNTKILSEPDQNKRNSYLTLSKLVYNKLCEGLNILAIDVPNKM